MARGQAVFYANPSIDALDDLAYAASRPEARGNAANWFLNWRAGVNGFIGRRAAAQESFRRLTEWLPGFPMWSPEVELSQCLFHMDSALECWVFAANAYGWALEAAAFHSVGDARALKRIGPKNIIGRPGEVCSGYARRLPKLSAVWTSRAETIRLVVENHDVSKHRFANLWGGVLRNDTPREILASVGKSGWSIDLFHRTPMSKVLLPREPKRPLDGRPSALEDWVDLVDLYREYERLLTDSLEATLQDFRVATP